MRKVRKISDNELMCCDMQEITTTSFTIQYLMEYENTIDKSIIDKAIKEMQKESRCAFVYARKNNWVENDSIVEVKEMYIDDEDFINNSIFFEKLDYKKETVRFYLINKKYLLIKFSHSVFDGKGALNFVEKLFSHINNSPTEPLDNSITEDEFLKGLDTKNKEFDLSHHFHLINSDKNKEKIIKYQVINMPKYHQGIIAKIAKVLTLCFEEESIRFMIPTDIRRHKEKKKYLSNLVLPTFINASSGEKWEDINGKMLYELKNKNELNIKSAKHFNYNLIPKFIRKSLLKLMINQKSKKNEFPIGGIISHLGRVELEEFHIGDNKAISFISLPVQQPLAPFSFVIAEFNNQTNIALSYYKGYTQQQVVDNLVINLKAILVKEINYNFNKPIVTNQENFVDILFKTALQNQDKIAIWDDKKYTYGDLLRRSSQIAEKLKSRDVKSKDKVIIHTGRNFDYIASVLGVLRIGASFVPIDKNETQYRISQIISETGSKIMLTNLDISVSEIETINLKDIDLEPQTVESWYKYDNSDEIYNIFTSGTTGVPKGVSISISNFSNYINWAKKTYFSENRIIMPLFTSLSVDLTMTSVFLPLISGGGIKIYKDDFNSLVLDSIYKDSDINYLKCTPGHLSLLSQNCSYKPKEWLIVGGENFKSKLYEKIKGVNNNVVNEYGPTETTVGSIYQIVRKNDKRSNLPIGLPIANTKVFLVDDNNNLIKNELEVGEIVISGEGVSKGYINTLDKNFRRFNDENCYFTGDLGYFEDGVFHCIGRKDSQIKINGQRIEFGEITSKLLEINGIKEVETVFYKNKIVSFVVTTTNTKDRIYNELSQKLSNNAIPSIIKIIDSLPLLNNGKVDKDFLINLIKPKEISSIETKEALNPIKQLIKELFQDNLLDLTYDDLHNIGLNSLDILILGQKLAEKYIHTNFQEGFIKNYIEQIPSLDIENIECLIKNFGGVL